jgi:hypothetical protein
MMGVMLAPLTGQAEEALISKVKSTWRAQDGESAEEIIAKASKVARFIPRGWEVGQKTEAGTPVIFSWARHRRDKTDDEYTIIWEVGDNGSMTLSLPYAKTMELGWQAFALSLIASEVDDGEKNVNSRFLHDVSNFNFVTTAQGKLGDLLRQGRCEIGNPVGVDFVPRLDDKQLDKGNFWHVQLSVTCNIPGPKYFTHDGVILFFKRGEAAWEPQSFFARRISTYPPGHWFDQSNPKEQEIFDIAKKAFERAGRLPPGTPSPFPR